MEAMPFNPCSLADAEVIPLALEFKARPFGVHSPMLQALLDRLRVIHPDCDKLLLVCTRTCEQWALGRMSGTPLTVTLDSSPRFSSLEEAEWYVFRLRWKHLTQRDLPVE